MPASAREARATDDTSLSGRKWWCCAGADSGGCRLQSDLLFSVTAARAVACLRENHDLVMRLCQSVRHTFVYRVLCNDIFGGAQVECSICLAIDPPVLLSLRL